MAEHEYLPLVLFFQLEYAAKDKGRKHVNKSRMGRGPFEENKLLIGGLGFPRKVVQGRWLLNMSVRV